MLEEISKRRAVIGEVVFMYVPAHTGVSPNEYADAAAKAGANMLTVDEGASGMASIINSRACIYGSIDEYNNFVLDDSPLYAQVRKKMYRWVMSKLSENSSTSEHCMGINKSKVWSKVANAVLQEASHVKAKDSSTGGNGGGVGKDGAAAVELLL